MNMYSSRTQKQNQDLKVILKVKNTCRKPELKIAMTSNDTIKHSLLKVIPLESK